MKKIAIFSIFSLILSFSVLIFPNTTYAKLDNYVVTIKESVVGAVAGAEHKFNTGTGKFEMEYASIGDDGKILKQVANKPVYTATLVKYAELICAKPYAQGALFGINEA